MKIKDLLDSDSLHHAYLFEGEREDILAELAEFFEYAGIRATGGCEFVRMSTDTFRMEDARNLKSYGREKSFSEGKKIFIITANSMLPEAQGSLLKVFEEPIPGTHFFLVVPDANAIIKTLLSRFYVVRRERNPKIGQAVEFMRMRPSERIEFIKTLIAEEEAEEGADSARARALGFLNSLETALHKKSPADLSAAAAFEHFLKVRRYLRMPGSSVKSLLESVALTVPVIQ